MKKIFESKRQGVVIGLRIYGKAKPEMNVKYSQQNEELRSGLLLKKHCSKIYIITAMFVHFQITIFDSKISLLRIF